MIAYNKTTLDNLVVQKETTKAYKQALISKEERAVIDLQYPVDFYTPHFFIRIGLFILTMIIMSFTIGFFSLFFMNNIDKAFGYIGILFAGCAYAALEYMIKTKKHYHSGVDDALLYQFVGSLYAAILYLANIMNMVNTNSIGITCCVILFIITAFASVRFVNIISSVIAYLSLLGLLFFLCSTIGGIVKALVPFMIMTASAISYTVVKMLSKKTALRYYKNCLQIIKTAALLTFYIGGNYFVVRELSNTMFDLNLLPGQTIPFGWAFWIVTIVLPLGYLFFGIKNKDVILIRVSLLLFAATIFTIRNYYAIAPIEIAMTIGGVVLIAGCYALTRFLREPKYGFTYKELYSDDPIDKLQVESLLIAQSFSNQSIPPSGATKFGGGGFGGGGASGEY
jgi:hypothetical protein